MPRILKDDHTGRLWRAVTARSGPSDLTLPPGLDLSRVDREDLPDMIETLREGEAFTRRLRGMLEAELSGSVRHCPVCDAVVTGRADRVYCGAACRQRAKRGRLEDD